MKNKLSQWLIDYVKKRNGVDLTNVPSEKYWTEMNPLRDIEQLPSNVVEFLNQKHNKEKKDNPSEYSEDKLTQEDIDHATKYGYNPFD